MSRVLSLCLGVVVLACAEPRAETPDFTVYDSSGIHVALNSKRMWNHLASWRLGPEPEISIGASTGDSVYELYSVRDAITFSGGHRVAILTDSNVRIYDSSGRFVRIIGRRGQGPGEMRDPLALWARGDSLVVFDYGLKRITTYTADGIPLRTKPVQAAFASPKIVTTFADGSFIVRDDLFRRPTRGFEVLESTYTRVSAEGHVIGTLPRQPLAEMGQLGSPDIVGMKTFGALTASAGNRRSYWIATGIVPVIQRYDPEGKLRQVIRWHAGDRSIPPSTVDEHVSAIMKRIPPENRIRAKRELDATPVADRFPVSWRLFATSENYIWVERFRPYTATGPSQWLVFDSAGSLVAQAELPESFTVYEAGEGYLLGKQVDGQGVEFVRKYAILR